MKKLMILAAVAMTAIASQAYDVKWGARNMYIPVAKDVTVSETGIVPTSGSKFAKDALTVSLLWVDSKGGEHVVGDFNTTGDGVIASTAITSLVLTDMNAEGSTYKPSYKFTATYATGDGTYAYTGTAVATSPIGNIGSGDISVLANFSNAGSWTYTANAVPEPTSGLLLLLGVAGLALRRRRA